MLKDLGYDFESVYVGGGTPTIMIDELCETHRPGARDCSISRRCPARRTRTTWYPSYLEKLQGRVQRLSVGVQSFDDGLLKQMDRYDKYGCGAGDPRAHPAEATPVLRRRMNADMIFNFPAQTEDILINDIERVMEIAAAPRPRSTPLYVASAIGRAQPGLARVGDGGTTTRE